MQHRTVSPLFKLSFRCILFIRFQPPIPNLILMDEDTYLSRSPLTFSFFFCPVLLTIKYTVYLLPHLIHTLVLVRTLIGAVPTNQ